MEPERKRGVGLWIALGCGIAFVGLVAFVVFIAFVVFGAMRQSTPYRDSVARAQNDPRVRAALGTPVKPGLFVSGSINTQNRDGDAKLDIPLSGPKGSGTLHVVATKTDGKWNYNRMYVMPKDGQEIDLLSGTPASSPAGPQASSPALSDVAAGRRQISRRDGGGTPGSTSTTPPTS